MIMGCGLMIMITSDNYLRKVIGLAVFQSAILIFYIAIGKIKGGIAPIDRCAAITIENCNYLYSHPLPHILMLTAIVVGFATLTVALAFIYRIYKQFNSISEREILLQNSNVDS